MKKYIAFLFFVLILSNPTFLEAQEEKLTTGPPNGYLLIIGGHASDSIYLPMLKEIINNDNPSLVIIPTARDDKSLERDPEFKLLTERFRNYGYEKITVLHTRSKEEANDESFVQPLKEADVVWFQGGRQWRLADSYLNTLTHLEIFGVLHRGGLIAGTSAGATIQGSYLVRGDTKTNTIMMGDHEEGLSFIKNIAIDQHLLARNRQFDIFEVLDKHHDILGIGLDENTGIIVSNNKFKVVGTSYVAIYDGTRWSEEKDTIIRNHTTRHQFYLLKKGDTYDLKKRMVIKK